MEMTTEAPRLLPANRKLLILPSDPDPEAAVAQTTLAIGLQILRRSLAEQGLGEREVELSINGWKQSTLGQYAPYLLR